MDNLIEAFLGALTIVTGLGFFATVAAPFVHDGALFLQIFGN
jgi:hypothetical protein